MSLEQAILELAQAVRENTAAIKGGASTPTPGISTVSTASAPAGKPLKGDVEGTRYYHFAEHNTVFKLAPGEAMPSVAEGKAKEVSGAQFQKIQKELAEKFAAQQTGGATGQAGDAASSNTSAQGATAGQEIDPFTGEPAAAESYTFEQVVDKLKAYASAKGRPALVDLLKKYGAASVPELQTKAGDKFAQIVKDCAA